MIVITFSVRESKSSSKKDAASDSDSDEEDSEKKKLKDQLSSKELSVTCYYTIRQPEMSLLLEEVYYREVSYRESRLIFFVITDSPPLACSTECSIIIIRATCECEGGYISCHVS